MIIVSTQGEISGIFRNENNVVASLGQMPDATEAAIQSLPDLQFPFYIIEKDGEMIFEEAHWEVEKHLNAIKIDFDTEAYFVLYIVDKEWEKGGKKELKRITVTNYEVRGFRKKGWAWFLTPPEENS